MPSYTYFMKARVIDVHQQSKHVPPRLLPHPPIASTISPAPPSAPLPPSPFLALAPVRLPPPLPPAALPFAHPPFPPPALPAYSFIPLPPPLLPRPAPTRRLAMRPVDHQLHMMVGPREGGAVCPSCCGCYLCSSAARPTCATHWVAFTERTLTMAPLGLCSGGQVHLTCVWGCYVRGCWAT